MDSWDTSDDGRDARSKATEAFCLALKDLKPEERAKYTFPKPTPAEELAASLEAKKLFAKNRFYVEGVDSNIPSDKIPIPKGMIFRVYEFEPFEQRDDIVTFVLPKPGSLPTEKPDYYYRCSYWPY